MKKSELRSMIRETIKKIINENKSAEEMKIDAARIKKEYTTLKIEANKHPKNQSLQDRLSAKEEQLSRVVTAIRNSNADQIEKKHPNKTGVDEMNDIESMADYSIPVVDRRAKIKESKMGEIYQDAAESKTLADFLKLARKEYPQIFKGDRKADAKMDATLTQIYKDAKIDNEQILNYGRM